MKILKDVHNFSAASEGLETYITEADLPALILTCAHVSGDPKAWLRDEWRPTNEFGVLVSRLDDATTEEIRAGAIALLKGKFTEEASAPDYPTVDFATKAAYWLMGPENASDAESVVPLACEELVFGGIDPRRPKWNKNSIAPDRDFHVVIVGAGESGLLTSHRLAQAGVSFTVFEKNEEVGGTWYENRYPGCRVDCNSFFYSFACARAEWTDFYGHATDVGLYLKETSEQWGIRSNIRFNHEVTQCHWDEAGQKWHVTAMGPDGPVTVLADVVVSAVGQLNRPMMPNLEGIDTYGGRSFHTARWDHSVDCTGRKIGIIGTGATSLQVVPQVAKVAEKVTVFARTTPWLLPTELLHKTVPEGMTWLLRNVPSYAMWYRFSLAVPGAIGMLDGVIVDPSYPPTEKAVSALNDKVRATITAWMEEQIQDRPDLRDILIPSTSPVGGKRIVRDNGTWARTLKRDNVKIEKSPIQRVTEKGILTADGMEHELDVLVYATGFHASKFLMPMEIAGRRGTLEQFWDGDARAYLGMTIPEFPNFFIFYGPNTNQVVHGGSAFLWSEFSLNYLMSALEKMLREGISSVDVKKNVYDDYCNRVDDANVLRAWGFSKVNSWYKNAKGRVTQNWPFSSAELWSRLSKFKDEEFRSKYL